MKNLGCDVICPHAGFEKELKLIVITGGPGAGKTAMLEFMRKTLCDHIAIVPESASILFGGGFWRRNTTEAKCAEQRAIYHVQSELENILNSEKNKYSIGLCDRGTLDGLAFWSLSTAEYFSSIQSNLQREFNKYSAVIHLSSPTLGMGYNLQNPVRTETAEQARLIDERIHEVWKSHPNYHRILSNKDFLKKIIQAREVINLYLPNECKLA